MKAFFIHYLSPYCTLYFSLYFTIFTASFLNPYQAYAQAESDISHKITLGSFYSSGDYGAEEKTEILYFPVSFEVARFPWVLSVTVPYLNITGPGDVFLEAGNIGRTRFSDPELINESGIGDVIATASYQMDPIFNDSVFLDLSVQLKIPTADETRDLGTGEYDHSVQVDLYKVQGMHTIFSTAGYRIRGKTPLYDLQDSAYFSIGTMKELRNQSVVGVLYDYREKASSNSFETHEIMPFVSWDIGERLNLMAYTIFGFTQSSADHSMGLQFSYTLP